MSAAVEVRELVVERGGRKVLHDLSFTIERGRVTGMLGPSGCGKTTLMRALVGVQIVRSGTVEVLGLTAGAAPLRARVGYLTQAPSIYGDLTIRENLRYFARVLGAPDERIEEALGAVQLTEAGDQMVRTLSGGQWTRASLATALLGDPELLVLDEPTVGLDPVLRRDLWRTLRRLADDGTTLVVSSHVMDEADRCDDLLLMRDGRLLAVDTPANLCAQTGADDLEDAFLVLVEGDG